MPKNAIKQRIAYAKARAIELLSEAGYTIIRSDNSKICLLAARKSEWRAIRIVLDEVKKQDEQSVRDMPAPPGVICTREIWLHKKNVKRFEIKEICQ